jgi:hypothetical protein
MSEAELSISATKPEEVVASLSPARYPATISDITKDILANKRGESLVNPAISKDIQADTDEDIRADTSLDKISD